ncbi:MAG: phage holin family protein [bacterium]|nr:phage holin family protein [bacterium]
MKILHWVVSAIAIGVAAYFIPGVTVSPIGALILVIVLALINILIKPLVIILTLPINILTLGLFTFVINALLIMLAGFIVPGFAVAGFWPAFWFAILLTLINWIFGTKKQIAS